ncbi:MAG: transposase [Candidatus Omnitrophica bacterium]|nr:transposase [Candidatus Omnitrophota bacterium]
MPRPLRIVVDGATCHVLSRGNNGQPVFHEAADYQRYLQLVAAHTREHRISLYHFALMPNHVHLVLAVAHGPTLSQAMHDINLTYAQFYKRRYQYRGHLWQGRFKSLLIDRERYLLACARYVELNPVRAKLVHDPADYAWSSYRTYAHGLDNPLIALNPLYETLGATAFERQERYREFVHDSLRQPDPPPRRGLGLLGGSSTPRPYSPELFTVPGTGPKRGRPRKAVVATQTDRENRTGTIFSTER